LKNPSSSPSATCASVTENAAGHPNFTLSGAALAACIKEQKTINEIIPTTAGDRAIPRIGSVFLTIFVKMKLRWLFGRFTQPIQYDLADVVALFHHSMRVLDTIQRKHVLDGRPTLSRTEDRPHLRTELGRNRRFFQF
jgi:hypothetical protein